MSDEKNWSLGPFFFRAEPNWIPDNQFTTALQRLVQIVERERKLFDCLGEIGRSFGAAQSDAEQRQNALAGLGTILQHLRSCNAGRDPMIALEALFADLENLTEGRETLFLKPLLTSNRRERPRQDYVLLSYAAAAIDRFVDEGVSERDAAARVIREIKLRNLPAPATTTSSNSGPVERILSYRARLRSGAHSAKVSGARSKQVQSAYFEAKKLTRDKVPEEALQLLFDTISPLIPKVS